MGYASKCFNAVTAAIVAAANATPTPTLSIAPNSIFQAAQPMAGVQLPYIVIALPAEPFESDRWGGTSNLKNGIFAVDVHIVAELKPEQTTPTGTPYGSDSQVGILTLTDQLQDILEAAYTTLLASSSKIVDVGSTTTMHQRLTADGRQIVATVRILFQIRFFAGGRNS